MQIKNEIIANEVTALQSRLECSGFDGKVILITGCNGLIGSYLLDFFYELGKKIKIKILCTSHSALLSEERFSKELMRSVEYFSWDAATTIQKERIAHVDYVYYCSGYAQPAKFIRDPLGVSLINTLGLYSILTSLKDRATFTYMSSSETYGDPDKDNIPTKELYNGNYSVTSNRAAYITAKRMGEVLCLSQKYRLNTKICRVSMTYGPGTSFKDERVVQQFIRKANEDKKIDLLDDGSAVRTFCYIQDSVEMILNISIRGRQDIYNVAYDKDSVTILSLAKLIGEFLNAGVSAKENQDNLISKNAVNVVVLSIERYLEEFGEKKFVDIRTGIGNILRYFNLIN